MREVTKIVFNISTMTTFGERLRYWADSNFQTYGECAAAVGIYQPDLSKYMNGKGKPDIETLTKFAQAGVSIDWLLTGKGPMDAKEAEALGADVDVIGPFPRELALRMLEVAEELRKYTPHNEGSDDERTGDDG